MKKLTFIMAVAFSVATVNSFAATMPDSAKTTCCSKAGNSCCKKMKSHSASAKAKCEKMCAKKA